MTEERLIDLVKDRGLMVSWDEEGHIVREFYDESPVIFKLSEGFLEAASEPLIEAMLNTYLDVRHTTTPILIQSALALNYAHQRMNKESIPARISRYLSRKRDRA